MRAEIHSSITQMKSEMNDKRREGKIQGVETCQLKTIFFILFF